MSAAVAVPRIASASRMAPMIHSRPGSIRPANTFPFNRAYMMPPKEGAAWTPVRITATVAWGPGRSVTAETVRLGRLE